MPSSLPLLPEPSLSGGARNIVELNFVKEQIKKSKPFVSAVVFSGGEPLMQAAVVPLAEFAKEIGLAIGIHTNGCYPEMARELVERKLVDKFFIDVKAPPDNPGLYGKVAGCGEYEAVKKTPEEITASVIKTIEIADSCGLELELRTTLIRDFIGSWRRNCQHSFLDFETCEKQGSYLCLAAGNSRIQPEGEAQENKGFRKGRIIRTGKSSKKLSGKSENKDKRGRGRNYLTHMINQLI